MTHISRIASVVVLVPTLCVTLTLAMVPEAYGQTPNSAKEVPQQSDSEVTMKALKDELQTKALKGELQIFKDFTQHILSTVYFSLGTVVVLIVGMLGFSWYQNFKVYERDKEALRESLLLIISQQLDVQKKQLSQEITTRTLNIEETVRVGFASVDGKVSTALKSMIERTNNDRLENEADHFRLTHFGKTPITDFIQLCQLVRDSIGTAAPEAVNHAVSTIVEHVEQTGGVRPAAHTILLQIVAALPPECSADAERLRSVLAKIN